MASGRGKKRDGSSAVAARRYSRHSIWYFSLCIADSSNCSASRALIYRPAGPLSRPSGSELSFAYSHGTSSSSFSFVLPPFAECTSPLPSPFQTPSPPLLSSLYTELSPGLGWIGWLPVFSDPWHRYPFTIPFRPSLSLSLSLSPFSLLDGYRSIYPPLLFILILCFISVLPLSRAWKSTHTLRALSPPLLPPSSPRISFSTSRNAFSWCSRSDTSLLSLLYVVPVKVTSDRGTRSLWEADDERSREEERLLRERRSLREISRVVEDGLRSRDWLALKKILFFFFCKILFFFFFFAN